MKANELRIGNLIEYQYIDVWNRQKRYWEECKIEVGHIKWLEDNPNDEDYRPIPLTEKQHNKFGVFKNGFNSFEYVLNTKSSLCIKIVFSKDYVHLRQSNTHNVHEDDVICIWNKDLTKRDMFVHEFQNLIFALTGEELTK